MEGIKEQLKERNIIKLILILSLIGILSFLLMTITFIYSSGVFDKIMFQSYFNSRRLMFMNFIPIFLLMTLFSLVFNKLWTGFSITSIILFIMSIVNKFKLVYRDEPFTFTDVSLVTESLDMAQKYKISLDKYMVIIILGLITIAIILKKFISYRINSKKTRGSFILIIILVGFLIAKTFYFSPTMYKKVGDKGLINIWSESQQFQSKGFIYPFIYSVTDMKDRVLEGYDEARAEELLGEKSYNNILEDEKVNIISIMLESYNDFSKFDNINFNIDIYENFHRIKEESYSGKLVTNVFAGGTINTEWSFLTGYNSHPKYIKDTNSFIWYLKEQGYRTEAMHPNYGWFYNRRNVNDYIGFDKYDYYENKYKEINEDFLDDYDFFDYIIQGYEDSKKDGVPYFNFSVTYQNHGPYSYHKITDVEYLKNKSHYEEGIYNVINNYMAGIKSTDIALEKLINYFKKENQPTIVVLFGDHNPWLGEEASGYNMMGVDIDLSSLEGFLNYYETPYLIWGNYKAKEMFNKEFAGNGPDISPNFLMAEVFKLLDWKGNEYMEYIMDVKDNFDVNHDMYFKEKGNYTRKLSEEISPIWRDFNMVQYYYSRNFRRKN